MSTQVDQSPQEKEHYTPRRIRNSRRNTKLNPHTQNRVLLKKNATLKSDNDSQQSKITNFLQKNQLNSNNPHEKNENGDQNAKYYEEKLQQMQANLEQKEEKIIQMKEVCAKERQKAMKADEQNMKYRLRMADSMLKMAEIKRKSRIRIDPRFGYFVDGCKKFIEGDLIINLREEISQVEYKLKELQEKKKSKQVPSNELLCLLSSYEFYSKELLQSKKELDSKTIEMNSYKQTLKLALKEANSSYCLEKWPIIYQKYQTLELLGQGGFGQVYKCYNIETNKIVAIKKIRFDSKIPAKYRDQFFRHVERQITIQKNLDHPNIARLEKILELDKTKNVVIFELEYCNGPELGKYVKKYSTVAERQAKIIIKQVLCALNYLSTLKERVIHYDLKPSNIIFHDGIIKIVDFGLCKVIEEDDETRIELTSQGVGTYYYLPPETFEHYNPQISQKVDIWSVGVIMYEMLFGKRPFGHGLSQNEIAQRGVILMASKIDFPADICKKLRISEGVKDFISDCLKYNPDQRLTPSQAHEHPYLKKVN